MTNEHSSDIAPILEAIADRAARLCESRDARIFVVEGNALRYVAGFGEVPFPTDPIRPLIRGLITGRAILDRAVVHVEDMAAAAKEFPEGQEYQRRYGHRTSLAVPLVRKDKALGVILLRRSEVRSFDAKHIELVKSFADQAAIAIENLHLSTELKTRNAELTEALEQQTATAEILKVISSSPTDIQPVLDAVVRAAARLCDASDVIIRRVDGDMLRIAAHLGPVPLMREAVPIRRGNFGGRAVLESRTVHVHDTSDEHARAEYPESTGAPYRTVLATPLLREGSAIGTIAMRRPEVRPFSDQQIKLLETFAAQAVIAIENVRLFNETMEALEQQTATADILRVISSSPTEIQPVLDAVAESAARLCEANDVLIRRVDGDALRLVAHVGPVPVSAENIAPSASRKSIAARVVRERRTMHIPDVLEPHVREEYPEAMFLQHQGVEYRTMLMVPLLREDTAIGTIGIRRLEVRPFSDKQIKLLETFAAQAAIAIENVRLFNETKEALEQQTATAEILKVISSSPTDIQPVLDAVAESAARLCGADDVIIRRIVGDTTTIVAHIGSIPVQPDGGVRSVGLRTLFGTVVRERRTLHIPDITEQHEQEKYPDSMFAGRGMWGVRTILIVPLLRENAVIGAIAMRRCEVRPFSDKQIKLLETFAAQAVIAIENVRLFNETKEALEQQTATADILKVISGSPTDIQPVLDAVAKSAARLCEARDVIIRRVDGNVARAVAHIGPVPVPDEMPITRGNVTGRAILEDQTIHIHDVLDPHVRVNYPDALFLQRDGSMLVAPMRLEGAVIGTVTIRREEIRPFSDTQVKLLETFAAQAVIAIENVRLFNETKEALRQQTATADVLKLISRTTFDLQGVLDTLVRSAAELCDAQHALYFRLDPDGLRPEAWHNVREEYIAYRKAHPVPLEPTYVMGRAVLTSKVVHIHDVLAEPGYVGQQAQKLGEMRTALGVPVLREGKPIGGIGIFRKEIRPFTERQIELVTTFADQAAIAIENVRLFNEIKEALEQQTATADILKVISSSLTDVQPVFDAIVRSGLHLFGGSNVSLRLVKGDHTEIVAGTLPIYGTVGTFPIPLSDDGIPSVQAIRRREVVLIPDVLAEEGISARGKQRAEQLGFRAIMCAPMLRENQAIGSINVLRTTPGPFTDKQIALLKTFADQAVIAIENVRLFKELQARNAEITESLEQQTATAEILKVISSSPTEVQPVFDAIVRSCVHLFQGVAVTLRLVKGDQIERAAFAVGPGCEVTDDATTLPWALDDRSFTGRAVLRQEVIHAPDLFAEDWVGEEVRNSAERMGWRAIASAPLLREDKSLGSINVMRAKPTPFSPKEIALLKTFADQAVIAIENVRLFKELQARNAEITEALEQQTATADILRVISSSPTDVQPVFDAIIKSGAHLFGGQDVVLRLIRGDHLEYVASTLPQRGLPIPLGDEGSPSSRAVQCREVVQVPDIQKESWVGGEAMQRAKHLGLRAIVSAPMMRKDTVIGVINVNRAVPGPFTEKEIALLRTFADQAVIAIENVRLFNETKEALEQQTVISEILRVISSSPTDVQPVFDAIVKAGLHLFGGSNVSLRLVKGDNHEMVASTLSLPDAGGVAALNDGGVPSSRAILRREVVQVPDFRAAEWVSNEVKLRAESRGTRAVLVAPMLRDNNAIGTILVNRATPGLFTDKQVALLKTFADQAVIAIENVRLFKELQARNAEVTEALEQQTATADILRVISSSPTDVQPVFHTILDNATRLCEASVSALFLSDGEVLSNVAHRNASPDFIEYLAHMRARPSRETTTRRAALERRTVHVADLLSDPEYSPSAFQRKENARSVVSVPLMREDTLVGVVTMWRREVRPFTERQISLVSIFANQAVIAIENVRLFKELQARNVEITESLEQQTATSEILKVISSSPTDVQPVFDAIVKSAVRLIGSSYASLRLIKGSQTELVASVPAINIGGEDLDASLSSDRMPSTRAILRREVIQVPDVFSEDWVDARIKRRAKQIGYRAVISAPMLRDNEPIGAINVTRPTTGPFTDKQVALLKTFADQAIIAIENVRLFKELQARNADITEALQQQTATSEILQVISGSPTDVTPVLETVARNAAQLCDTNDARVYVIDGDALRYVGGFGNLGGAYLTLPLTRKLVVGRTVIDRSVVHIEDLAAVLDEFPDARGPQQSSGTRTTLAVPLMRESEAFGAILMRRTDVRPFTEKQIELVKTFAYQAAIGIENVRLFNEIQDKSRQLEVASRHKSEFLANMSHELRTPLNAVIGFSEALVEKMFGELNAKQEDYLKDIHSSGRHLLSLINDILDLSKIEAGRMELELSDFSLPAALKNAMTLVRERAQTHRIEMKLHVDSKLGDIRADERKFKQIVLNLLSNAVKFTPDGGRVEVDARANGGSVKVSVKDTGVGIAAKDQAALFEEFRQVGRGSTGKREGTGLGLALTRRFVELHGGKIGVESVPGKGSAFTFTLPLSPVTRDRERVTRAEKRKTRA